MVNSPRITPQITSNRQHIYGKVAIYSLVGGLEYFLCFHILGIIIPIDFHIFSEGSKPPTSLRMKHDDSDIF